MSTNSSFALLADFDRILKHVYLQVKSGVANTGFNFVHRTIGQTAALRSVRNVHLTTDGDTHRVVVPISKQTAILVECLILIFHMATVGYIARKK